jgi:hypothetical protein
VDQLSSVRLSSASCSLRLVVYASSQLLAQFHSSSPDYSRGVETLRRICRLGKTYLVPTSCILSEEIPLDTGTVLRSNFSDVYKGSLGGRDVAIKVFRVDNDDIQLIETASFRT